MKVKFSATLNNFSLKKEGEYRIEFKSSLLDLGKVMSLVRMLNEVFNFAAVSAEGEVAKVKNASFYSLKIDREGESKIMFSFSYENIHNDSLAFFGQHQEENLTILAVSKSGENKNNVEEEEEGDEEDNNE
jgi:hypothetical protein